MKIKTFVISMPTATERRRLITENLDQSAAIDWQFFDALGATSMTEGLDIADPREQREKFGRELTAGEIGTFKSHYTVIRDHARNGSGWILVLEDDVWLDPQFEFDAFLDFCAERNIDHLRLFAKAYKPAKQIGFFAGFREVIRFDLDPFGAQAYLINIRGAEKFLSNIRNIVRPVDDEMGRFWEHGLIPCSVFPFPALERSLPSSLAADRDRGDEARRPVLKRQINRIRDKLNRGIYRMIHY